MKKIQTIIILIMLTFFSCGIDNNNELTKEEEIAVADSMIKVTTDFLRYWEHPFYPQKAFNLLS